LKKVLVDINHPAHVHFFRNPIQQIIDKGHEVLITSREKDVTLNLLDEYQLPHRTLSSAAGGGALELLGELIQRDSALIKISKQFKPDVMVSIGGTFIAHAGRLTGIPSLVFYDTENARLQNLITYPFATQVYTPDSYESWVPKRKHIRYKGYHELSYLHPNYFTPDLDVAVDNGLIAGKDNFVIRIVSWQANHDIGETGWNPKLLDQVVSRLAELGNVIISTEAALPSQFERYTYQGDLGQLHHLLAYSRLFVGESATMASEAAVLGVPAIYCAEVGRGYTNELEAKYGLVKNVFKLEWSPLGSAMDQMLQHDAQYFQARKNHLLEESVDVSEYVTSAICSFL
jgi:predicted glycosyltransferase